MTMTIQIDARRRIKVFVPEGGLQLECRVEGMPGWFVDDGADVSDSVIAAHLDSAAAMLQHVSQGINGGAP